ncbi:MAG: helix-turn-helix transcriptional regulator [Clostridia bacterium]|nr:helix-turn-helix transcriptional regulator [Clostridia bacterium]
MTKTQERLAQKIRTYREANNLTQFEFAESSGMSEALVSLIERAKENVQLDTMDLLAVRMNISVAELFSSDTTYFLIDSDITIEDSIIKTYGIGVIKDYRLLDYILDISTNQDEIQNLVFDLNEYELDAVHFREYIEDYLE